MNAFIDRSGCIGCGRFSANLHKTGTRFLAVFPFFRAFSVLY